MPHENHKSITISKEAKKQLGEIKTKLELKSESATANKLIKEKYFEIQTK